MPYDFDLIDLAQKCGIAVLKKLSSGEYQARCPFCGDSQKHRNKGHLHLNPAQGKWYCNRCGEGGYTLSLYAKLRGVDNRTAYRELSNGALGRVTAGAKQYVNTPEPESAPIETRDAVYRAFLDLLPLLEHHRQDLLHRGLPESVIARNLYRSIPETPQKRWSVCRQLLKKHNLENIPGFYTRTSRKGEEYWDFAGEPGCLIPVIDAQGKIQGLQVRMDITSNGKYRWFSSRGFPRGTPAKAWVHVAYPLGNSGTWRVWVTEGPLKADISAHYLGKVFVAVPGVAAWREVEPVLKELGAKEVVIAYDADRRENVAVQKAQEDLAQSLRGYKVIPAGWDPNLGNGLDDAIVELTKRRIEVTEATFFVGGAEVKTRTTVTTEVAVKGSGSFLGKLFGRIFGKAPA